MYVNREKAYKEKMLIKEIDRLDALLFGDENDQNISLEEKGKICDAVEDTKKELNKLWQEMHADHKREQTKIVNLLTGIFMALVFFYNFLFFETL